jgi:uncharacterized membrane protein
MTQHPAGKALQETRSYAVRAVPPLRPLGWLARGWRDVLATPLLSLLHGLVLALFGVGIFYAARDRFWLLAGAFSGFLLVAPVLATGLYAISREREFGGRPGCRTVLNAWRPRNSNSKLVVFGLLLALAGTGWVLTSAALITAFSSVPIANPVDFLRWVVLNDESHLFEVWMLLGAVLAAPVFASSVVAVPMLLDQRVTVFGAVFTSWRVVMDDPVPMALWAVLIMSLTLLGMATAMLGLVVVVPWLGHASWHAYRDLVRAVPNELLRSRTF